MKFPTFLRKNSWKLWPRCMNRNALCFVQDSDNMLENLNSEIIMITTPESSCLPLLSDQQSDCGLSLKIAYDQQELRSERLFFKQGDMNSISAEVGFPFKECVVLTMKSKDPYMDFWMSMEEMIEAYGWKDNGAIDWDCLEELLEWYLKMNKKTMYGYIIGAFVDLYVDMVSSSSTSSFFS